MSIYMKATDIKGSVTAQGYTGWIELNSIDFSGIALAISNTGMRNDTKPHVGEIVIIKPADSSSVALFDHVVGAQVIPQVEIDYVNSGNPPTTYQKLVLSNVIISHYSERSFDGMGRGEERMCLNFDKIQKTYTPRGADNRIGNPQTSGYDVGKKTKM